VSLLTAEAVRATIECHYSAVVTLEREIRMDSGQSQPAGKKNDTTTKGRTFPAEILTRAEVRALLKACSGRAPTGIRNRALVALLYRTGLRIAEALALMPKDLDPTVGTVTVLRGKGGRRRTVGMDPEAFALVERWLDRRSALRIDGRRPVFCTLAAEGLQTSYVRALLPRLAARAGIQKRVHPHGLRHTCAAELMAEGVPLNVIQVLLGHSNAATTGRYLQHIAPENAITAARSRKWGP
jgi:site-specific recombinase XerD